MNTGNYDHVIFNNIHGGRPSCYLYSYRSRTHFVFTYEYNSYLLNGVTIIGMAVRGNGIHMCLNLKRPNRTG